MFLILRSRCTDLITLYFPMSRRSKSRLFLPTSEHHSDTKIHVIIHVCRYKFRDAAGSLLIVVVLVFVVILILFVRFGRFPCLFELQALALRFMGPE